MHSTASGRNKVRTEMEEQRQEDRDGGRERKSHRPEGRHGQDHCDDFQRLDSHSENQNQVTNDKHKEEEIPTATYDGRDSFIRREHAA